MPDLGKDITNTNLVSESSPGFVFKLLIGRVNKKNISIDINLISFIILIILDWLYAIQAL